jgi:hypothetical protein
VTFASCSSSLSPVYWALETWVAAVFVSVEVRRGEKEMRRLTKVLAVLGLLLAGCSSGQEFVFGEDDLCVWVTEDDVTDFARDAYEAVGVEWDGEATLITDEVGEYECQWTLTGVDGEITAYSEVAGQTEEVVSYEELDTTWVEIGANVNGHPDFDAEVVINNQGFGQYAFLIPTSEDQLVLSVYLPIEDDSVDYEKPLFIVANGFLEEMNWTS